MQKWLIFLFLILLSVSVNAKCGDNICDPNEDCSSCPDDCLCTKGPHNEKIVCCNDFSCQECEKGYCHDRGCNGLEGFTSIFKKIECYDNGSIKMEIKFQELNTLTLTPDEDLKVYMKEKNDEKSFNQINGTWINPARTREFRYTKIADTSTFSSDENLFKLPEKYYVRVKYKMGRSNSIFEDTEVTCPGVPIEPIPIIQEEPEVEEVEPPRKKAEEPEEEVIIDKTAEEIEIKKPEKKSMLAWYIIAGAIIALIIIFFIKYRLRITKKL